MCIFLDEKGNFAIAEIKWINVKSVFNNSLLASRKICAQSLDNNFSAKTKWQKVARGVNIVIWFPEICSIF